MWALGLLLKFVVPENIHTLIADGIGNSRGVHVCVWWGGGGGGLSKDQEIPDERNLTNLELNNFVDLYSISAQN